MGNSAALAIASRYGFQGECTTLSTGCIAGSDASNYAYDCIAYGDHDVMIAGASEASITPISNKELYEPDTDTYSTDDTRHRGSAS